ncbi:MAG: dihydrofolate reductase [Candidatus Gracilibacteria bacterium]|jgi:dihydrofolate reductase
MIKPRFIAFVAASVDGRISLHAKKRPDWTSPEDWEFFQKSLAKMDAVLVGRNTYEAAKDRLKNRNTVVFSRKVKTLKRYGSVCFVNPTTIDLRNIFEGYKTIGILGGTEIYGFMLKQKLLDEIFVTLEPLLFGRGKIMITGMSKTTKLRLISVKKLNRQGSLLLHYRVEYDSPQAVNGASQKQQSALRKDHK